MKIPRWTLILYSLFSELSCARIPRLAVGTNSFRELVEKSDIFVDKSFLLYHFLRNSAKVLMLTYPPKWGKSVNLDMIKRFLAIELDPQGVPIRNPDEVEGENRKLFFGNSKLEIANYSSVKIYRNGTFYDEHPRNMQGRYPVIFASFQNVLTDKYDNILYHIKVAISNSFREHGYLIKTLAELSKNDSANPERAKVAAHWLREFEKIYLNEARSATEDDIKRSLRLLSEILRAHFNEKVYVLVDAYDGDLYSPGPRFGYEHRNVYRFLEILGGVYGSVFSAQNDNVEKGLLTGVLRIEKTDLFAGVENRNDMPDVREYGYLDGRLPFNKYYGFSKTEIKRIFQEYNLPSGKREEVRCWYYGYHLGMTEGYNPWSVVNYLNNCFQPGIYWPQPGQIEFYAKLMYWKEVSPFLRGLVGWGDSLKIAVHKRFNVHDLRVILDLYQREKKSFQTDVNTARLGLSYLFHCGYFTYFNESLGEKEPEFFITSVRIPNCEILYLLRQSFYLHSVHLGTMTRNSYDELKENSFNIFKEISEHNFTELPNRSGYCERAIL